MDKEAIKPLFAEYTDMYLIDSFFYVKMAFIY